VSKELTPSIISLLLLNLAEVGANSVTRLFLSTILGEVCTACVAFLFSFYSLHCPCVFLFILSLPLCLPFHSLHYPCAFLFILCTAPVPSFHSLHYPCALQALCSLLATAWPACSVTIQQLRAMAMWGALSGAHRPALWLASCSSSSPSLVT
jgi:ABC-type glycerol-3-phosphate transport system permease component